MIVKNKSTLEAGAMVGEYVKPLANSTLEGNPTPQYGARKSNVEFEDFDLTIHQSKDSSLVYPSDRIPEEPKLTGNFSMEYLQQGPIPLKEDVYTPEELYNQHLARDKSIAAATTSEQIDAFLFNAGENNVGSEIISKVWNYYITGVTKFEPDGTEVTDAMAVELIHANNLDSEAFGYLKHSKSKAELNFVIAQRERVIKNRQNVEKVLGDKNQLFSSLVGSIDVDLLLGVSAVPRVAMMLGESRAFIKLAAAESTVEVSAAIARTKFQEGYSKADAYTDVGIGMAMNMGLAKLFGYGKVKDGGNVDDTMITKPPPLDNVISKFELPPPPEKLQLVHLVQEPIAVAERIAAVRREMGFTEDEIKFFAEEDKKTNGYSLMDKEQFNYEFKANQRKITDIQNRIAKAEKEFDKEAMDARQLQEAYDSIAELRTSEAQYRQRSKELEPSRRIEEQRLYEEKLSAAKREAQIRQDQHNQNKILAEQFKHPKYETANINRKEFFKRQEALSKNKKAGIINEIELKIKSTLETLKKIRKEMNKLISSGSTERKINNRRVKIEALQREMDELKSSKKAAQDKTDYRLEDEKYTARIVDDMMENAVDNIAKLRVSLLQAQPEDLIEMKKVVDELFLREPELARELHNLLGSKLGNKVVDIKKLKIDKNIEGKALTRKQKAIILALGLGGLPTLSFAGEDDGLTAGELGGIIFGGLVLALFGKQTFNKLKESVTKASIKDIFNKTVTDSKRAEVNTSEKASIIRNTAEFISDKSWTSLTSSIAPFVKEGGKVKEFVEKLFFSHAGGEALELSKTMWVGRNMTAYARAEDKHFELWLAENKLDASWKHIDGAAVNKFRQEVNNNLRQRNSKSKAIKDMTDDIDIIYEDIWDRAAAQNVQGFEGKSYKKGKTTRLWNKSSILEMIESTDANGIIEIKKQLAEAIRRGTKKNINHEAVAKKLFKKLSKRQSMSESRAGSELEMGDDILEDLPEIDDVLGEIGESAQSGRTRNRIPFDMDAIEPFEININGVKRTITKDMFIENDAKLLLDRVSVELNSASALAKGGFTTELAARRFIDSDAIPYKMKTDLHLMLDGFLSKTPESMMQGTYADIIKSLKDVTIAEKLMFVMFSVPFEIIKTVANGGIAALLRNTSRIISRDALDVDRLEQLMSVTATGTGWQRADRFGFIGASADGVDGFGDIGNSIRMYAHKIATNAMMLNGLTSFTDMVQRANLLRNEDILANYITKQKGFNKIRASFYGIDDNVIKMFKDDFKYNKNGTLKKIDMSGWSADKVDAYGIILKKMGFDQVVEHTLGETSLWGRRDLLGSTLNTLVGYPIMLHNIQLQRGLKARDSNLIMDNVFAFGGTYLGLQAKYGLFDKEVSDEQLVMYSLMNTLPMSALSAITSMGSPASLSLLNTVLELVDPVELERKYND